MLTLNQQVLTLYDSFKSYSEEHTIREVAEHIYPDWTIKKLSDFGLVVTAVIETSEGFYEFRVQVAKSILETNVFVKYSEVE